MNADERRATINELTARVIGCAYRVSDALGCGFLEKVYENAMAHDLRKEGLRVEQQKKILVYYDGAVVGEYVADLVVEGMVVVELKAVRQLSQIHIAQCLNYLKATGLKVCLLINFGNPKVDVKRIVNRF